MLIPDPATSSTPLPTRHLFGGANIGKARQLLGYEPTVDFITGLERIVLDGQGIG